jgi:hypothetical protein
MSDLQNVSVSVSVDGTTWSTPVPGSLPDPTGLVNFLSQIFTRSKQYIQYNISYKQKITYDYKISDSLKITLQYL